MGLKYILWIYVNLVYESLGSIKYVGKLDYVRISLNNYTPVCKFLE